MSHARAVVAGVLAVGIVMLLMTPTTTIGDPERALAAFVGLLAVLALLVGTDIVAMARGRKPPEDDD